MRSFETTPIGTGQMADTTRFTLTLDQPGAGPSSVVGKFASADEQSRGTGLALRAYEIEVRFYREVAARVGARLPAVYLAEVEPETGWFTLLMEDIAGADPGRPDRGLRSRRGGGRPRGDGRPARAVLGGARAGEPRVAQPEHARVRRVPRRARSPRCSPASWSATPTRSPRSTRPCAALFVEHLPTYLRLRSGPRTASHGDFRLDNLLFQPEHAEAGGRRLADRGLGRRVHRRGVLHRRLPQRGGSSGPRARAAGAATTTRCAAVACKDYSLEQLRADTRRDTFAGLLMAIVASMVVQRTERGDLMFLTSSSRHAQHALDVDAPALLLDAT